MICSATRVSLSFVVEFRFWIPADERPTRVESSHFRLPAEVEFVVYGNSILSVGQSYP